MTENSLEQNREELEPTQVASQRELTEEASDQEGEVSGDQTIEGQIVQAKAEWLASDEFKKAVQSEKDKSIYKELQPLQDKIRELEASKQEAVLAAQEGREFEQLGDTEEVRDFQQKRRDVVTREAKVAQYENYWGLYYKRGEASLVAAEFGVEVKDLLEASSPEELRAKAQTLQAEQQTKKIRALEQELEQVKKAPQRIDSGAKSVAGVDYDKMSAKELIQHGINKEKRK